MAEPTPSPESQGGPKADLAKGFEIILPAFSETSRLVEPSPTLFRFHVDQAFIDHVNAMSKLVGDAKAISIKTGKFPGQELVRSDHEGTGMWTLVVDDETFHFVPDQGAAGTKTLTVFMGELEDAINGELITLVHRWYGGALLVNNGTNKLEKMDKLVDRAFPDLQAAEFALKMSSTIQATLATKVGAENSTSGSSPATATQTSRRRRNV
ncbi:hypothetical protein [Paucibacter soli]|uniref:hypothetical protein n=1 Tax=Paucibacter soli TaxID=3133433 RepID=UPI0030A57200